MITSTHQALLTHFKKVDKENQDKYTGRITNSGNDKCQINSELKLSLYLI